MSLYWTEGFAEDGLDRLVHLPEDDRLNLAEMVAGLGLRIVTGLGHLDVVRASPNLFDELPCSWLEIARARFLLTRLATQF